jgi:hypothetical protein
MLHHMDGQQFLIQRGERRTDRDPDAKQSSKKGGSSPARNRIGDRIPEMSPPSQVKKRREK